MHVAEATDGGVGRYLYQVIPQLCALGLEVELVYSASRSYRGHLMARRCQQAGARVTELNMVRNIHPVQDTTCLCKLIHIICNRRPDIVHAHSSKAGALARIASVIGGQCCVAYTPHAFAFQNEASPLLSQVYLAIERLMSLLQCTIIAVSESECLLARSKLWTRSDRVVVVRNGISLPFASGCSDRTHPANEQRVLQIGFLGRLDSQKQPLALVSLANKLRERGVEFRLNVAGRGSLLQQCRAACEANGLSMHVHFLGYVNDVSRFYNLVDLFVTTSAYEGSPYSILDAMAHSLAVVGYDASGVRDIVIQGETGLLAPMDDIETLANHIALLANDLSLAKQLGCAGRKRVETRYTLDRQIHQLIEVYDHLANCIDSR